MSDKTKKEKENPKKQTKNNSEIPVLTSLNRNKKNDTKQSWKDWIRRGRWYSNADNGETIYFKKWIWMFFTDTGDTHNSRKGKITEAKK